MCEIDELTPKETEQFQELKRNALSSTMPQPCKLVDYVLETVSQLCGSIIKKIKLKPLL